ncbi:MAG: Gfo/Idh/MocA family oxidoreductase [Flavobacteriales bacterium]|nr:Gfo/Idh/MocA family oxidoreductase [Flavobacteriales bacterium]
MIINDKSALPQTPMPIVIIGAGGIIKNAHLPAYKKAGFKVKGIFDLNFESSKALGAQFEIANVYKTLEELIAHGALLNAVFDVAVPADKIIDILVQLPGNSTVLIQKPMGENIEQANEILEVCRELNLTAAVNFQLRYTPFVNAARSIIDSGAIGEVFDIEVKVTTVTPWHLWDFLATNSRVEILYHSIHYIDMIRSFFGDPQRLLAKTVKHPTTTVSSTRSSIIFDYGDVKAARINTNHDHNFGSKHQHSYIKWEGTKGAIYAKMGLNLNYPDSVPDVFEYFIADEAGKGEWKTVELEGSWFPDAFIGPMANIMRFKEGADVLPTSVEDAIKTMQLVESAYQSSNRS